jgi:hypothetical protein
MQCPCDWCDGRGRVHIFEERTARCDHCDGSGLREAAPLDYDGETVVVRATGFRGVCHVFGETTIIVMNENEEEIEVASIEEIDHENFGGLRILGSDA